MTLRPRMRNRRRMKNQKRSSLSHPRFDSNELTLRVLQMHGALGLMRKIGGPKAAAEPESGSEEEEQSSSEEEQELSESEEGEESVEVSGDEAEKARLPHVSHSMPLNQVVCKYRIFLAFPRFCN